jgi:hypothetical protein
LEANESERAGGAIMEFAREPIPKRFGLDPIRDIRILCPMNRNRLGARSLNIDLRNALNPPGPEKIEKFGSTFAPKDKAQGSEYPAVILPATTQHYAMLQRKFLYTGLTRGKTSRRATRTKESCCDSCKECLGAEEMVQFKGMACSRTMETIHISVAHPNSEVAAPARAHAPRSRHCIALERP